MMIKRADKCCWKPEDVEPSSCCQVIEVEEKSERFYFRKFLCHAGLQPDNIKHLAPPQDPPDFILTLDGRQIGVEVTEFHSQTTNSQRHTKRQAEAEWEKLQPKLMCKIRKENQLDHYGGYLSFIKVNSIQRLPRRSKHINFAEEIVKFSLVQLPLVEREKKCFDTFKEYPLMRDCLKKFCLKNTGYKAMWRWSNAGSIGVSEAELIRIINRKINGLRKPGWDGSTEKWLLLISGSNLSQAMIPEQNFMLDTLHGYDALNRLLDKSGFDKTLIYQYLNDSIFMFENNRWGIQ